MTLSCSCPHYECSSSCLPPGAVHASCTGWRALRSSSRNTPCSED